MNDTPLAEQRGSPTRQWRLMLRFGVVGLLNSAFGYVVFTLCLLAGAGPGIALVGGAAAGCAFNFQTSQRLVFLRRGDALRFIALYGTILSINWVALEGLRRCGIPNLAAQALLTLPVAALAFFGQQSFVFGRSAGRA